jgi:hypothetical protein
VTTLSPLTDDICHCLARALDDAGATREPSHSDLEFQFQRAGLTAGDPKTLGQNVGKAKRVRAVLSWAIDNNPSAGRHLVGLLISCARSFGGFRSDSPNYVGAEPIKDLKAAFFSEGFELTSDGELRPLLLDSLAGASLTDALLSYIRRARTGADDAALIAGTGKDLLEATARHVLVEKFGSFPEHSNFPTTLGQAFIALGLATSQDKPIAGEHPSKALQRALFDTACAVNRLRNKEGTGHGRPWLPTVRPREARRATETMGIIADLLLDALAAST